MRNILICGASSFVAKGFMELLQSYGYNVDTFGRANGKYLDIDKNSELAAKYDADFRNAVDGGLLGEKVDCKRFLEDYFNIEL